MQVLDIEEDAETECKCDETRGSGGNIVSVTPEMT
jgi:hypothetical protein